MIDQIILFLEGKASTVLDRLSEQMDSAAEALDYERAAMLRDQVRAIERTVERQMLSTTKKEDLDVYGLAREGDRACVQVFFVRGTQMTGRDHFVLEGVTGESDGAVLGSLLQQYYESAQSIPRLVVVPVEPEGRTELEEMLTEKRGANVEIRLAQRGEKRQLLEMARENAAEALDVLKVRWLSDPDQDGHRPRGVARRARPPRDPAPYRVLRQLEHPGRQPRLQHGRLPRRATHPPPVPEVPHQDGSRARTTSPPCRRSCAGASSAPPNRSSSRSWRGQTQS